MFYRLRKQFRTRTFERAIRGILDTPPIEVIDAPWCIVSMVANTDVSMYLLALKSFYRKLGRGKVVAIVDRDMPQTLRETLARHIPGLELVVLEDIPTGTCQRGGTWERLLYVLDRSDLEYTIQLDCDTLTVGENLDEVVYCIETNTPFTMSDGFSLLPLPDIVDQAEATPSDYIGVVAERMFRHYPAWEKLRYVRGSSGFAGFSRRGFARAEITRFHQQMEALVGRKRWREWGTEQVASNFAISNSPGAVVLPYPEYASFTPQLRPSLAKFFHFIGEFRFSDGYFAARGREVIAALQNGKRPAFPPTPKAERQERLPLAFTRTLTLRSAFRYLAWRAQGGQGTAWLRLRSGPQIQLRPASSGNGDYGVAYEIFVHRYLASPVWIPRVRVKRIVDIGANVGFSCLYWLAIYWRAEVIAFEPHPGHVAQWRVNVARNGLESRATLHAVAAGAANGRAWISDAGTSSRLSHAAESGCEIQVVDAFELLADVRIDILKIDIEGSEYELLEDPRFGALDVYALVLEWHARSDRLWGREWCEKRLAELGFRVYPIFEKKSFGMMWAYKTQWPVHGDADHGGPASRAIAVGRRG